MSLRQRSTSGASFLMPPTSAAKPFTLVIVPSTSLFATAPLPVATEFSNQALFLLLYLGQFL